MSEDLISQEEVQNFKRLNGYKRGTPLMQVLRFIHEQEGDSGLKKLEEAVSKAGYPLKYDQMKATDYYPIWIDALMLVAISRLFKYNDKKLEEMGRFNAKTNFLSKILLKYFVSEDVLAKSASKIWRKYHTVGDLKTIEYNKDKRYAILGLYNFPAYPIICRIMKGYFEELVGLVVKKRVICEETKCILRGDDYHEFKLTW